MADGFKDYLWECVGEVPSAFRRGMIVVTIIANAAVVAALYLGWHLQTFTALQLISAGVLIAVLEVIVIFPYKLWKANKATIAHLRTPGAPFPDWQIGELFHYINPNAVESEDHHRVGGDVLDRFSTGELTAWGRLAHQGGHKPLTRIDNGFWQDASFTFWFLASDHEQDVHATSNEPMSRTAYRDIRVNKAHALRIWMK